MTRTVTIDSLPESVHSYRSGYAVVVVDVIRATTTAVTAVSLGRRCLPAPTVEAAANLARVLDSPLLVGELGGNMPYGFHLTNSPAAIASRSDVSRPMILLSTSGTKLLCDAAGATAVYAACLRNFTAQARHLASHHDNIAILGAGTRGEFREEDQLCCAWIAELLLGEGYTVGGDMTAEIVERWNGAAPDAFLGSKSVEYLRQTGQEADLAFILQHVDDLDVVVELRGDELFATPSFTET